MSVNLPKHEVVARLILVPGWASRGSSERFAHVCGGHTFAYLGDNCSSGSQKDRSAYFEPSL